MMQAERKSWSIEDLQPVIEQYWGYSSLRPLQERAMKSVLDGRDSLVVLPTGGGKSLCYQAPAMLKGDMTIVISPLISLMKDQVDGLRACGVPAVQIDSTQSSGERSVAQGSILRGEIRLLFVSPERLVGSEFYRLLQNVRVSAFAVDEAHCISHWGHDFRPEYRQLRSLKELFPGASMHAYTATATQSVRDDIVRELGLVNPDVLVGSFDRPNLTYRVLSRRDVLLQVTEVIERHKNEAGIVYCISRNAVNELTSQLRKNGINAVAYHAGLTAEERSAAQEAFSEEQCDLIVATVAFGMGIDRSNVRFVMHTGMPKSIEHYQQETGRAGRDGLEAECVLLYSNADILLWRSIMEKGMATNDVVDEAGHDMSFLRSMQKHLEEISRYCRGAVCRHRALVEYFGQSYEAVQCQACDICLGETVEVSDADTIARKILSCIARVKRPFGVGHIVSILRGENIDAVRRWEHDKLSTYGIMKEHDKVDLRDWIDQLIGQAVLNRTETLLSNGHKVPVVSLNQDSLKVLRSERSVRLLKPMRRSGSDKKSPGGGQSWEGVDRELFEALRLLRRKIAQERGWQPYMVFSDATLRELSQVRPLTLQKMIMIYGIGRSKLQEFGEQFLEVVREHCQARGLTADNVATTSQAVLSRSHAQDDGESKGARPNARRNQAFELYRSGASIEKAAKETGVTQATAVEYLCAYIREAELQSVTAWVSEAVYELVKNAVRKVGYERLKPIYLELGERISYDDIRVAVAHLSVRQ